MGQALKRKKSQHDKVTEMMERKVDFTTLKAPGTYLDLYEKLALDLAREYQISEDPNYVSISWPNQKRAQDYFNEHGFEQTLDHMFDLKAANARRP